MNEISRSTEPWSVTHDPKSLKIEGGPKAKVMDLVPCALVHMKEWRISLQASCKCCELAEDSCHE